MPYRLFVITSLLLSLISCVNAPVEGGQVKAIDIEVVEQVPDTLHPAKTKAVLKTFPRSASFERLKAKVDAGDNLVIHLFVPLCDNENQGIVPVPKALGNGENARNNLYWGAKYGVANYFPKIAGWKAVSSVSNPMEDVLERRIFTTKNRTGNKVYLVADAYQGDRMKQCLEDMFSAVNGDQEAIVKAGNQQLGIYGSADLIAFSGHNGLMDTYINPFGPSDGVSREVVVLGCLSQFYFDRPLRKAGGFPLITTTNLMAPEAYVSEAVFRAWSNLATDKELRLAAGVAYDKYQKCGVRGATKLFAAGWDPEPSEWDVEWEY